MTRPRLVVLLYTVTIFLAAALLFLVQPLVGKMVLPLAGGSPQVWNTSLVFFQTALLAGYLYAHLSVRWLGVRRQALLHLGVLALPLLVLPIALPDIPPPTGGGQSLWVLTSLGAAVGLPFFVLAAASPLLQRWLAATEHPAAEDPYFLYAGSNAGSLVGLLIFPLVLEPQLPLSRQSRFWTAGYLGFVALAVVCALVSVLATNSAEGIAPDAPRSEARAQNPSPSDVSGRERLFWMASAAVPSALLIGVTQYITSQIAPISLLWVLPLAVYLGTFVAAFSRRQLITPEKLSRLLAIVAVVTTLVLLARIVDPEWVVALLHISLLGLGALLCHMRLANARPSTGHLTEYYLLISAGGAIGGSLSALAAPVLFNFIAEYPIAISLACLFRLPFGTDRDKTRIDRFLFQGKTLDVVLPLALAAYMFSVVTFSRFEGFPPGMMVVLAAVLPTIVAFTFSPRPLRFALGLMVLLAAAESGQMYRGAILLAERTFFGVHRVIRDPENSVTILYHGATVHGIQSVDPALAPIPLGYYHPTGPAGSFMAAFGTQPSKRNVAVLGEGTGALTALAGPHQRVTLFEIDPEVVWIAEESGLFTYVASARAAHETVVGDGRLELSKTSTPFDLIILDAFSSGNIPLHLMTHEALQLYLDHLAPGGAMLFHISNRHLSLAPVLSAHARDLGLTGWQWIDVREDEDVEQGIFGSDWILLAPDPETLGYVPVGGWRPLAVPPLDRAWTDDFSDLLSVQRW